MVTTTIRITTKTDKMSYRSRRLEKSVNQSDIPTVHDEDTTHNNSIVEMLGTQDMDDAVRMTNKFVADQTAIEKLLNAISYSQRGYTIQKGHVLLSDQVDSTLVKGFIVKLVSVPTIPRVRGEEKHYQTPEYLDAASKMLNLLLDNLEDLATNYDSIIPDLKYCGTRPECRAIMDVIAKTLMFRSSDTIANKLRASGFIIQDE